MPNEILLFISLVASYSLMLAAYKLFGKMGLFVWIPICTILANIEVTVLVNAFGMEQTLGNTLFASSYLATDILSERHGEKDASKAVWVGIFTSVVFIGFSFLWRLYTPSENDWAFESIKTLFSNTPRMLTASLLGYAVSELLDVKLYHAWWKFTEKKCGNRERFLWVRNNFSTLVSQFVNIVIFNFGAFLGLPGYDIKTLISITGACYLIYVFTSILDTPFIYLARKIKIRS
ncbi:MAG: queuosine precursor transporter [Treponema sp.]|nr:queuosine precursor transporter [Treponema sp.]